MSETVPSRDGETVDKGDFRVMGVDSDDVDDLVSALSSETARRILSEIYDESGTATELSERLDTSVQNIQYHLGNLDDAGLIQVVDTEYSPKGREMKVYAPSDEPLLVFVGREEDKPGIERILKNFLGMFAFLGALSLAVQLAVSEFFMKTQETGGDDGGIGIQSNEGGEQAAEAASQVPPGLLFFAGGTVILLVGAAWWYWQNRI